MSKMKRKIITIDAEKCNGCGLCVEACHESAIQMIDGKAQLVSDKYCDGLGDCLPACPMDAIKMIEREADEYSQEAVNERVEKMKQIPKKDEGTMPCGCPGTHAKKIDRIKQEAPAVCSEVKKEALDTCDMSSKLNQWPIQIKLINPAADYLTDAHLLVAADCAAYAYGNFHNEFINGKITIIGCPKLDDNQYNMEKFAEIFKNNNIKSVTVVRMEVPCCAGIISAVKDAMLKTSTIIPYKEVVIGVSGEIKSMI